MRLLLIIPALFASIASAECPGQPLTFDQVMINFSHDLTAAANATQSGQANPTSVSDVDLQGALNGIATAIECGNAVLNDTTGQLYPPEYFEIKDPKAQQDYLGMLDGYMSGFVAALQTYQQQFQQLLAEPQAQRDFTAVNKQTDTINGLATDAHGDLQNP